MSKRLLAPALLLAATTTAAAQPSATAPAAPAPAPAPAAAAPQQTHAWGEVSHINGQLVKVGEQNEYEKRFRRTVIASNPVGWMAGFYGVSLSHAVTNNVALRGDVNYVNIVGEDDQFWEVGVGAPLYLKRAYQGAFIEPGFIVRGDDDQECSYDGYHEDCRAAKPTMGPQMLAGWQRTWDSGFTIAGAFGVGRNLNHDEDDGYYGDDPVFVNGYFRVGYAF